MDRNLVVAGSLITLGVALRKESVDRNGVVSCPLFFSCVALRKESVDRNFNAMQVVIIIVESLSARRAWIEMSGISCKAAETASRSPQGERG